MPKIAHCPVKGCDRWALRVYVQAVVKKGGRQTSVKLPYLFCGQCRQIHGKVFPTVLEGYHGLQPIESAKRPIAKGQRRLT